MQVFLALTALVAFAIAVFYFGNRGIEEERRSHPARGRRNPEPTPLQSKTPPTAATLTMSKSSNTTVSDTSATVSSTIQKQAPI